MKRSTLTRKTPLRSRKRLSPIGRKARREREAVIRFREALRVRSGGMCEAQTPACPTTVSHPGSDAHHIWPSDRDKGLHNPDRGVLLCRKSHDWVHRRPEEARALGLLRKSWEEADDA